MIAIQGLHKSFGDVRALAGLDLHVESGQIYCLLGPNGAGKSTTINSVLGFIRPDAGTIEVASVNVGMKPESARRALAYIPEQVQLYNRLSGLENLRYFYQLSACSEGECIGQYLTDSDLVRCLIEAGLPEPAIHQYVVGYSKGMRQKVGIAIALARRAPVMLLDEPTSGLDPEAAWQFGVGLRALADRGVAVLMATHDLFRAQEVADRIGILMQGRLVEDMSADSLCAQTLEALYLRTVRPEREAATC